MIIGKQMTE